jgi:hypothetical protein
MSKMHHSELKDLQATRSPRAAARAFRTGNFTRASGVPMTGVDITYLGCFRMTGTNRASRKALFAKLGIA